jgi:hypothetical protein
MTNEEIRAEIDRLKKEGEQALMTIKAKYEGAIEYLQSQAKEEDVDEASVSE